MSSGFRTLADVVSDDLFPQVDIDLRRGRHIGREDVDAYTFLVEALDHLEPFYRRFGAELVHRSDGYVYLLPSSERIGRTHLDTAQMLVGQALALLYLDPATVQKGGVVERELVLERLSALVGADALVQALLARRRRSKIDERVAAEQVRAKVSAALRKLDGLGFVDLVDSDHVRLRPAVMRFAEPVRTASDPTEALERLIARGEVDLDPDPDDDGDVE